MVAPPVQCLCPLGQPSAPTNFPTCLPDPATPSRAPHVPSLSLSLSLKVKSRSSSQKKFLDPAIPSIPTPLGRQRERERERESVCPQIRLEFLVAKQPHTEASPPLPPSSRFASLPRNPPAQIRAFPLPRYAAHGHCSIPPAIPHPSPGLHAVKDPYELVGCGFTPILVLLRWVRSWAATSLGQD